MKKLLSLTAAMLAALTVLSSSANAHEYKTGDLTVMHPWARATAKSAKTGAAYFIMMNAGTIADKLIDVRSDVALKTQIHLSSMTNGVMKMKHVDGVSIPPNGNAELKPGGYHIMFKGLKAPFQANRTFPLTLVFENNGAVTVNVKVEKSPTMKNMDHTMDHKTNKP